MGGLGEVDGGRRQEPIGHRLAPGESWTDRRQWAGGIGATEQIVDVAGQSRAAIVERILGR